MSITKFAWAMLGIFLTTAIFAAEKTPSKNGKKTAWAPLVFPENQAKLPVKFKEDSISTFFSTYHAKIGSLTKQEFETTADFEKRIADIDAQMNPFNKADSYVFQPSGLWARKYDADSESYLLTRQSNSRL